MFEGEAGVTAESPTADQAVDQSAGTLNTEQQTAQQHTIPYPRFAEVNANWRAAQAEAQGLKAQLAQAQQYIQQVQRLQQRSTDTGVPLSSQERMQMAQAAQVLKQLFQSDPELAEMYQNARQFKQALPHLAQGAKTAQQIQEQQQKHILQTNQARIAELAQQGGIPQQSVGFVEDLITGIIGRSPEALARFQQGDPSIVPWAYKIAEQNFFSQFARQGNAQVAQTKQATRALPPRPGGGAPAAEAPPKWDAKDPGSMAKIHAAAQADLMSRLQGSA